MERGTNPRWAKVRRQSVHHNYPLALRKKPFQRDTSRCDALCDCRQQSGTAESHPQFIADEVLVLLAVARLCFYANAFCHRARRKTVTAALRITKTLCILLFRVLVLFVLVWIHPSLRYQLPVSTHTFYHRKPSTMRSVNYPVLWEHVFF